jgi:plastocyanin
MNRPYFLILICILGTIILYAGCTTQQGGEGTSIPTTVPSTTAITTMQTPETIVTTIIPNTISTAGTTATGEIQTPTTAPGGPTTSTTEDHGERIKIKAENFAFDRSTITVPAGSQVIIEFENKDLVGHNMAFYTSPSLSTLIYRGEIITGPRTIIYTFTAPSTPGTYYFHCDPHPSMDGQFIVT